MPKYVLVVTSLYILYHAPLSMCDNIQRSQIVTFLYTNLI